MAGQRPDQDRVEVVPGLRGRELEHAVARVDGDAEAEPDEHSPVDPFARASDVIDRRGEEREVNDELADPLAELGQRLVRLQVVEADEVDEQEGAEERDHDPRRPRQRAVRTAETAQQVGPDEEDREHLREADLAGDVPVELLEAHREDGGEEQEVGQAARRHQGH